MRLLCLSRGPQIVSILYISDWNHDLKMEATEQDTQIYVEPQKVNLRPPTYLHNRSKQCL